MKKEIKKLLDNEYQIHIKWKNFHQWQTSFKGNCWELIQHEGIKIRKKGQDLVINYSVGCHKISSITNLAWLEREILNLVYMKYMYLGDKCSIDSRFGTRTVNY